MKIKEFNVGGKLMIQVECDSSAGDRARMVERNHNREDVPVVIMYNIGSDFHLRTKEEKLTRVNGLLKNLRLCLQEAVEDVGGMVGAKAEYPVQPHEIYGVGNGGQGGRKN